jgi:hypothetical protein
MLQAMASLEMPKPGSRTQYTKCMLLNFSFLNYHRRMKSPVWSLFVKDPGIFNEDVCESTLSVLARTVSNKPNMRTIDAANKNFKRITLFHATCVGLQEETSNVDSAGPFTSSWNVPVTSLEVRHTIAFLERLIHSIGTNKCMEYDPSSSFTYGAAAGLRELQVTCRFKSMDFFITITENLWKFKKQQLVPYITTDPAMMEHWPEAKAAPPDGNTSMVAADEEEDKEEELAEEKDVSTEEDEEEDGPEIEADVFPSVFR